MLMSKNTMFKRNKLLVWSYLEDDIVLVDHKTEYIHVLNSTGRLIWEVLETYRTKDELVLDLYNVFSGMVEQKVIEADIEQFFPLLITAGIVEIAVV